MPNEEEQEDTPDLKGKSFPSGLKNALATGNTEANIPIKGRENPMYFVDKEVTVIAPGGPVFLESRQEVFEALKCRECEK